MTAPVRVLALDHYFDQDLRALEAHPSLEVRRFPYQRLRGPALRMLGPDVATGLQAFMRPQLEPARRRYAAWLRGEVRRLYLERAFDVLVLPSDTFFYVRALPEAAHTIGVPVVVVQKETVISEATMRTHAVDMGALAPFNADLMTVCSERHRQFWLRAGADPGLVHITGQPRFDIYATHRSPPATGRTRVLFLTYQLDAYVPGAGRGMGLATWAPLREATERVLIDAARSGSCEVVVKCHPQQDHRAESARLASRAGATWNRGVSVAADGADTRELIVASDLVIGFQTTGLYEAVAAGRPAIYAAWGDVFVRVRDQLLRFDLAPPGCVQHADSPQLLAALLAETRTRATADDACAAWYEEALGAVDGHATGRVADWIGTVARAWAGRADLRHLEARRRQFAAGLLVRSVAAQVVWGAAKPIARLAGEHRRVDSRLRRAHEGRVMAMTTLRHPPQES